MAVPADGLPRFELLRPLGAGGQGRVSLVRDREREGVVAIKRLSNATASSLLRLKNEFRAVAELRHPGLVRLFELGQDDEGPYFTMEAIDGDTLDRHLGIGQPDEVLAATHVGQGPPTLQGPAGPSGPAPGVVPCAPDLEVLLPRLAPLLPQMMEALAALHGSGLVHQDLKPSNVMVSRQGTVKLLDFGILAQLGARGDGTGTPDFMAPEQVAGEVLSPATDLYALGILLYSLLAGRTPFVGDPRWLMAAHLAEEPPPLTSLVPSVPAPLALACRALLDKQPERRPTLDWLDRHLLAPLGWTRLRAGAPAGKLVASPLIGRAPIQERLRHALTEVEGGRFVTVVLRGPSGIGKTRLVEWLSGEARGRAFAVLRGRARAHERVPYNAVDGAIDDLARLWMNVPQMGNRVADLRRAAASAFPVFAEGPVAGGAATRTASFAALAALLGEAARSSGVVVALDDLQWADADSLSLLESLVAAMPAGVLVAGTLRDEPEYAGASARLARWRGLEIVDVPALSDQALAELIAGAARKRGRAVQTEEVVPLVRQCAGRAMLAEVVGWGLAARSGQAAEETPLDALLDTLPAPAQDILTALEVADHSVEIELLARVVDQTVGEVEDTLVQLVAGGLVHRTPRQGGPTVDIYHDLVRAGLHPRLEEPRRRALHGAFVERLQPDAGVAPERLVRHLLGAGRLAEAGQQALEAAGRARDRFAHDLAAQMYEIALRAGAGDRQTVLRLLAACLDGAARYHEAAARWRELGALVSPAERGEIGVHEAASLLSSSDVVAGYARLDEAMAEVGAAPLGSRGFQAIRDGLRFLLGPRSVRRRPADRVLDAAGRIRVDRDVHLAVLATYFDPLAGVRFVFRARQSCLRLGGPDDAAVSDYLLAHMAYYGSHRRGPVRLAERYRRAAEATIAGRPSSNPIVRAYPPLLDGIDLMRRGQFEAAARCFDELIVIAETLGIIGTTEHLYALTVRCAIEVQRQRVAALAEHHQRLEAAFNQSGGGLVRPQVEVFVALRAFLLGDRDGLRRTIDDFIKPWPEHPHSIHRSMFNFLRALSEAGYTDPRALRRQIQQAMDRDKLVGLLSNMESGFYWSLIALVEARALLSGDPQASRRAVDRYAARAMRAPPLNSSRALRARGYAAGHQGDTGRAVEWLLAAEREAETWKQPIDVAVARHQRGKRLGGDEGARLRREAQEILATAGTPHHWVDEDEVQG